MITQDCLNITAILLSNEIIKCDCEILGEKVTGDITKKEIDKNNIKVFIKFDTLQGDIHKNISLYNSDNIVLFNSKDDIINVNGGLMYYIINIDINLCESGGKIG